MTQASIDENFRNVVASLFVRYNVTENDAEFLVDGYYNGNFANLLDDVNLVGQQKLVWRIANWSNLEERN